MTPPAAVGPPPPVLAVSGLGRRFGPGCHGCIAATGPGPDAPSGSGTNRCPHCGTVVGLWDVSFEVGPGEVLGVIGESGSGKTTLLRTLHLDGPAQAGRAEVEGFGDLLASTRTVSDLRAEAVVMVHQNALAAGLWPDLAAEANVAQRLLAGGDRHFQRIRSRARSLLAEMEIEPARHGDPLATFSGGMAQRVQMARALVSVPAVLLLDEPTTGLDPSVQAALLEVVQRVADRMDGATVVVSHDLDVIRLLADRAIVLHHGRIVEEGLCDQVLEDPRHPWTQLLVASRLR